MCGRFYILHGIFMGAAGGVAGVCSQAMKESLNNMRFIVTVSWSKISSDILRLLVGHDGSDLQPST